VVVVLASIEAKGRREAMQKIDKGFILPSVALTIKRSQVRFYKHLDKVPEVGDVVYGTIGRIGHHSSLENASGRIHTIHNGTKGIFVFGNRYAPDHYEGIIPDRMRHEVDLLARSGMIGIVKTKNAVMKDPTRVRIHGYVLDKDNHTALNTRFFPTVKPKKSVKVFPRSKMILICGTSMNAGKTMAAVACCWALASMGHPVRASKVTGTASLKDILHMNDAGADPYADFTFLGYPSTYLLPDNEVLSIFNQLDLKFANNRKNYWIVEFADGINQRETAMLLHSKEVRSRIHKLIFCASDAFGALGGLKILEESFGLIPDALSGVCSSSPLHVRELSKFSDVPVFNSADPDLNQLAKILLSYERRVLPALPSAA
jgi:hypothetical protein